MDLQEGFQGNSGKHIYLNSTTLSLILHQDDTKDVKVITKLPDKYISQHQGADQHRSVIQKSGFVLERTQGLRRTQEQVKITLEIQFIRRSTLLNSNTKGLIIINSYRNA